jgi:hypothetical protein
MALFNKTFSDSELLDGIRNAHPNRRIFENRLYEKYAYMIREATWKHQLSDDECAMAYSDTILTALEHIETGRFKGLSSFKTYLSQIFSNKCIDLLRKNSAQKQATTRYGPSENAYRRTWRQMQAADPGLGRRFHGSGDRRVNGIPVGSGGQNKPAKVSG